MAAPTATQLNRAIHARLARQGNPAFAKRAASFFKQRLRFHGVPVPRCRELAADFHRANPRLPRARLFSVVSLALASPWFEDGVVALAWLERRQAELRPAHAAQFERWAARASNWAHCDFLFAILYGRFLERFPKEARGLRAWVSSKNQWKRRAAIVSFVQPAKKGLFGADLLRNAAALARDRDDPVNKGTGWALREYGKANPQGLERFLRAHPEFSRVTVRYALERVPEKKRRALLAATRPA